VVDWAVRGSFLGVVFTDFGRVRGLGFLWFRFRCALRGGREFRDTQSSLVRSENFSEKIFKLCSQHGTFGGAICYNRREKIFCEVYI
jgi:hypothetical protein